MMLFKAARPRLAPRRATALVRFQEMVGDADACMKAGEIGLKICDARAEANDVPRNGSLGTRSADAPAAEPGARQEAARRAMGSSGIAFAVSRRDLQGATSVITVVGELDLASAPNLKWTLGDALRSGARNLVVDLSPVTFIDSTALGVLVGVQRSLEAGSLLALAGAEADVFNIFEMTGLDSTFQMFSTIDQALAWVREREAATG